MPKPPLKAVLKKKKKPLEPLWKGPEVDGVTQSMLNSFLACKERFRVQTILGLQPPDSFHVNIEYGQMWHLCEEVYAAQGDWESALKQYCMELVKKYRTEQELVNKWYQVCRLQFPVYVEYWKTQKDVREREPIHQEVSFNVPYRLPSGRFVRLRGKWDSVDMIGRGKNAVPYLQENKTKGEINEEGLRNQLSFDMQTMIYLVALWADGIPAAGVRYNVIRRPLSGGKHTIRPHKATKNKPAETMDSFYARLEERIREDKEFFFMRWKVRVSKKDILKFRTTFLDPILEHLCKWYDFVTSSDFGNKPDIEGLHWRTPYGIYSPLARGGTTLYDEYLMSGNTAGLKRAEKLFREL